LKKNLAYASIFSALGDEIRLELIEKLSGGPPLSISELSQDAKVTRQGVTKHLKVLERAGLVVRIRSGRETLYELNPQFLKELKQFLDSVSREWDQSLVRLKTFVGT
jgi:DNA-binding transcriptional ArsR family regulator